AAHAAAAVPGHAARRPRAALHRPGLAGPRGAGGGLRLRPPRSAALPPPQLPRRPRDDARHHRDHARPHPPLKRRTMSPTAPSRIRRMLRIVIPALLVVAWVAAAAIGGPYFGRVSEVSTNDPTAYLPTTAEATQVQERLSDRSEEHTSELQSRENLVCR